MILIVCNEFKWSLYIVDPKLKTSPRGHPPSQKPKTKNLKLAGKQGAGVTSSGSENSFMEEMIPTEEAVADNVGIIYIIVGCSLGLVIIVAALASAAYVRTKKGRITAESNGFLHVYVHPVLQFFLNFYTFPQESWSSSYNSESNFEAGA